MRRLILDVSRDLVQNTLPLLESLSHAFIRSPLHARPQRLGEPHGVVSGWAGQKVAMWAALREPHDERAVEAVADIIMNDPLGTFLAIADAEVAEDADDAEDYARADAEHRAGFGGERLVEVSAFRGATQ